MNEEEIKNGDNQEVKTEFTKDSKFSDIMMKEGGMDVLMKHGVPCPMCPMATYEYDLLEIGAVCQSYGLDLEAVLEDLNN